MAIGVRMRQAARLAARLAGAIAALWLIPCALALSVLTPAAFADDAFDRRHRELLTHKDLQFAFEDVAAPKPVAPPRGGTALGDFLNAIAPAFTWLLWGALGVGVAFLLWFIGRELLAARFGRLAAAKAKAPPIQEPDYRPEIARARTLLEEADRLAAEGRYDEAARTLLHRSIDDIEDEAARTLLHRSIDDIEERRPRAVGRALTSREIGALGVLPASVREAFAPIVRAVELSWFGGRPLDASGWSVCRKAYSDFAFPQAWQ
jgi:hypothetical protein